MTDESQPKDEPRQVADLSADANLAADRTFGTSRSWRRAGLLRMLPLAVYWIALIVIAIVGIGASVLVIAFLAIVSMWSGYRQRSRRSLAIGRGGVTYAEPPYLLLKTPWTNVERIVVLGRNPASLALLLRESGRADLVPRKTYDALKSTPYPLNRVIPLQPFTDPEPGGELERRLRHLAPDLFASPPMRLERPTVSGLARALGIGITALPLLVAIGAVIYSQLTDDVEASTRSSIGFGLVLTLVVTPILLLRYRGLTGERLPDAIGRILLSPGRGESRLAVFAPVIAMYIFVLVFSQLGGNRLGSTATGPSCNPASFTAQAPALAEPQWPGSPHPTVSVPLGIGWTEVPLTEAGVRNIVRSGTDTFISSYTKSVRGYIRNGLVELAVQRWPAGGLTTLYVHELVCTNVPANGDIAFPGDHPTGAGVTDATRLRVTLGLHSFVHASYRSLENGTTAMFDIYEWTQSDTGHVFRLVARTDGSGDPRESIEDALTALANPS